MPIPGGESSQGQPAGVVLGSLADGIMLTAFLYIGKDMKCKLEVIELEQVCDIKILSVWANWRPGGSLDVLTADGRARVAKYSLELDLEQKALKRQKVCTFQSHIKSQYTCQ